MGRANKGTNIEIFPGKCRNIIAIMTQLSTNHVAASGFRRAWKRTINRASENLFREQNFGYGGAYGIEVAQGWPRFRVTDPNRYDCASSAEALVARLENSGIQASLCRAFIMTVSAGAEINGAEDYGSIKHVFVKIRLAGQDYYTGVTPLDRRVLKILPVARLTPANTELLAEGGIQDIGKDSGSPGLLSLRNGEQHPMEWFAHQGNLVYLFAGLISRADDDSFLFLSTAVIFEPDLPKSFSFHVAVPRKQLRSLRAKLPPKTTLAESFFRSAPGVSEFYFPTRQEPESDAVRLRGMGLLTDLLLRSQVLEQAGNFPL